MLIQMLLDSRKVVELFTGMVLMLIQMWLEARKTVALFTGMVQMLIQGIGFCFVEPFGPCCFMLHCFGLLSCLVLCHWPWPILPTARATCGPAFLCCCCSCRCAYFKIRQKNYISIQGVSECLSYFLFLVLFTLSI